MRLDNLRLDNLRFDDLRLDNVEFKKRVVWFLLESLSKNNK